ncbi:MAG: carboxypeptidase-like regulatory domain-containing protein [Chitinophagaceae bacterium]
MKKILLLFLAAQGLTTVACTKPNDAITSDPEPAKGIVKGKLSYADGNPIANAKVVIENTILYASYIYATTNTKGEYSVPVPIGSWKASVQIEKEFLGKKYKYDLHPDNANPFAGVEGAVRNFTWKISGAKPEGGFYGSPVKAYGDLMSFINMQDVELTLTPDGNLIDGRPGAIIKKRLVDVGGGEYGIDDVPIGKYTITARNAVTNEAFQIRIRNTGDYSNSVTGIFNSDFFLPDFLYHIVTEIK